MEIINLNCKFRIPLSGKKVIWEITNQCNYRCKYCIFNCDYAKNDKELDTNECFKVIDDLFQNGYNYLKITGGEPFIRKDLLEIVKYAITKDMHVDISTNASLINHEIIGEISKIKIDMIHVSLDGHNIDTQEEIRGAHTFQRTIDGIKHLTNASIYTRVGAVIFKGNENHLEDIVNLVLDLKVNELIFSIMMPVGRMLDNYDYVTTKTQEELTKNIEILKLKYKDRLKINYNWDKTNINNISQCPAGDRFLYINNLGNVAPCTWLVTKSNKYLSKGTLKDKSLIEILKEKEIQEFLNYKNTNINKECIGDII